MKTKPKTQPSKTPLTLRFVALDGNLIPCAEFVTVGQAAEFIGHRFVSGVYLGHSEAFEVQPGAPILKRLKRCIRQGTLAPFDFETAEALGIGFRSLQWDEQDWTYRLAF